MTTEEFCNTTNLMSVNVEVGTIPSPTIQVALKLIGSFRPGTITHEEAVSAAAATLPLVAVDQHVHLLLARNFRETGDFHPESFGPLRPPFTPTATHDALPKQLAPMTSSDSRHFSAENIGRAFHIGKIVFRGAIALHRGIESANLGRR